MLYRCIKCLGHSVADSLHSTLHGLFLDGSIKRLKFHDLLSGANEEMGWDDVMGRLDADLLLMTDALRHALTPLKANISSQ